MAIGFTDGRSQDEAPHVTERSSKSRERDIEGHKGKDRDRDMDHVKDRERYQARERGRDRSDRNRDHDPHNREHRGRCEQRERCGYSNDRDYHRSRHRDAESRYSNDRDYHRSRHRDAERRDYDKGDHHRHRSHSRSRSRSSGRSKRVSKFDQGPSQVISTVAPPSIAPGQLPSVPVGIPGMPLNMFNCTAPQAMTQQATRHARRVYVGGLPPTANEQTVATYFNQVMAAVGGNTACIGDAVVNVYINHAKKFAFVEMRSVAEASNAMALDGVMFEGAPVKVRRPTDYNPTLVVALGPSQPNPNLNLAAVGLTPGSAEALEGPDRIFVGGLPNYFTEAQVRELLETFGPLRGFDLVKDRETGNSRGYAFCTYQDLAVTDIACAALNGIQVGNRTLTVRRANQGAAQPSIEEERILQQAHQQVQMQRLMYQVGGALPTKVVCLTQAVSEALLADDEEYRDLLKDMTVEANRHGNLMKVVIPRPDHAGAPAAGVGKVFLQYADVEDSTRARTSMHGRKFDGKQVVAVFYPENKFEDGDYDYDG